MRGSQRAFRTARCRHAVAAARPAALSAAADATGRRRRRPCWRQAPDRRIAPRAVFMRLGASRTRCASPGRTHCASPSGTRCAARVTARVRRPHPARVLLAAFAAGGDRARFSPAAPRRERRTHAAEARPAAGEDHVRVGHQDGGAAVPGAAEPRQPRGAQPPRAQARSGPPSAAGRALAGRCGGGSVEGGG